MFGACARTRGDGVALLLNLSTRVVCTRCILKLAPGDLDRKEVPTWMM